jgi:hypothetical protein
MRDPKNSPQVVRPILGRLHCGFAVSCQPDSWFHSHPADPWPAPLRRHVADGHRELVPASSG